GEGGCGSGTASNWIDVEASKLVCRHLKADPIAASSSTVGLLPLRGMVKWMYRYEVRHQRENEGEGQSPPVEPILTKICDEVRASCCVLPSASLRPITRRSPRVVSSLQRGRYLCRARCGRADALGANWRSVPILTIARHERGLLAV